MTGDSRSASIVLWTGGKDSALALCRALDAGYIVDALLTFVPEEADFRAHPLAEMRAQASSLGIPHETMEMREPYREAYVAGLKRLASRGIKNIITGDIDFVDGRPHWITECAFGLDLNVCLPLWQAKREQLLRDVVSKGLRAELTHVDERFIPRSWLGRTIDADLIEELKQLADERGIDICGENGEYHTMVRSFGSYEIRTMS